MVGHELVERVDERRRAERSEEASNRPRQPHFGEKRDSAAGVAGNRRPVVEDEPPAFVPRVSRHTGEQAPSLFIGERRVYARDTPKPPW